MNLWKVLGVAGLTGVAAAGVIIARDQRQRTQLAPEEIRARLHERLEQAATVPTGPAIPDETVIQKARWRWLRPGRRRGRSGRQPGRAGQWQQRRRTRASARL
jgi:hypothetical protein